MTKDLLRTWWLGVHFRGFLNFIMSEKLKALEIHLKIWNREVFGDATAREALDLN